VDIVPTDYTVSVTATNGDGTSDAVVFVLLVQPSAPGATTDDLSIEIDFDALTKKLRVPQVTDFLPAGEPGQVPSADEGYLMTMTRKTKCLFVLDTACTTSLSIFLFLLLL
jgi:hypothetical protein